MKKIFAFLVTILLLTLCACVENKVAIKKEDYLEIINNSKTFIDESGNEVLLSEYQIPELAERYNFEPLSYAYIDLDGNSTNETVVADKKQIFYLILFEGNDNKIHGYSLGRRSLLNLKTDGEFMQASSALITNISKITDFQNNKPNIKTLAEINEEKNIYKVGNKSSKEETEKFYSDFNKKPNAEWESL